MIASPPNLREAGGSARITQKRRGLPAKGIPFSAPIHMNSGSQQCGSHSECTHWRRQGCQDPRWPSFCTGWTCPCTQMQTEVLLMSSLRSQTWKPPLPCLIQFLEVSHSLAPDSLCFPSQLFSSFSSSALYFCPKKAGRDYWKGTKFI
jgi:hypothetical protein